MCLAQYHHHHLRVMHLCLYALQILSRLYMRKLELLLRPKGHRLSRCRRCGDVFAWRHRHWSGCKAVLKSGVATPNQSSFSDAEILDVNFHGGARVTVHSVDDSFTTKEVRPCHFKCVHALSNSRLLSMYPQQLLLQLRSDNMSWRGIFWRLWGVLYSGRCDACHQRFPMSQLNGCLFHPMQPLAAASKSGI